MNQQLPSRRNLESFKKEAKGWLDALRAGKREAWLRLERVLSEVTSEPSLRDVQLALAREHGFAGWKQLKAVLEQRSAETDALRARTLEHYQAAAQALLDAYRTGTPEAMERHFRYTWHRRTWQAMRTYVQLDLGEPPASPGEDVEITLDDARRLVAVEYGFANWHELESFARTVTAGRTFTAKPLRLFLRCSENEWEPIAGSRDWEEILELLSQHPAAGLSGEGQMTDTLLADLPRAGALSVLALNGCREVTDAGIRQLAQLPSLEHLDLSGTGITDDGIQVLRHLPRLKSLSLGLNQVTERGVSAFAHCDQLERLTFWAADPSVGDAAVRALAGKRKLRHLELSLGNAGLAGLQQLPVFKSWQGGEANLTLVGHKFLPSHLSLRGTFTDEGMQHLRGLNGLFSLNIEDRRLAITAAGLEPLVSLPRLGALAVDAKDDWMPLIAQIPRLRHLGIQDTVAGDDGFSALSRSESIEYVWGRRCHNLRTRGFRALARMPALRGLSVSCLNVADEGIAALPRFPALRELMPMDVPDAGYRHIGRCENLQSLILMYCRDTTDAATEHITSLANLSYYFNSYTGITDRTPELLSSMDSLERITFDTCHGLTNAGVGRLARLPKLRELRVSGHGLTAEVQGMFRPGVSVFYERS